MRKIHVMVCSGRKWKHHARERLNYQQVKMGKTVFRIYADHAL
ncbi:hypothetical protein VCHE09_2368 [Vibrio paracholerae HE-09]|nr:hypothetical protein VCHE09_2368 [Vibrio paracholerae HE-09]